MKSLDGTRIASTRGARSSAVVAGLVVAGLMVAGVGGVAAADSEPVDGEVREVSDAVSPAPGPGEVPAPEVVVPVASEPDPSESGVPDPVADRDGDEPAATGGQAGDPATVPDAAVVAAADPADPVDWVTQFPDPGLRTAVQDAVQSQLGIDPVDATMGDLAQLTYLYAYDLGITSLVGVDALTGLYTLQVSSNALTSLAGVEGLPNLQDLSVEGNALTSLAGLAGLPSLVWLVASNNALTSLGDLGGLPALQGLDVSNNQLTSIDTSTSATLYTLNARGNPALSPSEPFTRGGATQSFQLDSTEGNSNGIHSMGGAYTIDGNRYTYVYHDGSGSTSPFFYGADYPQARAFTMGTTTRGVTNSAVFNESIERREVRTVDGDGTVLHTVTVRNVSQEAVTAAFHQSIDTELNGNDQVPLLSDGRGGVIIRDDAMELYLQPVSGIGQVYAGRYGAYTEGDLDLYIGYGYVVDAAGRQLDEVLATGVDSNIYYSTPSTTLEPGQSYTFSYRESLYLATDPYVIRLDYVTIDPDTGEPVAVAYTSQEGEYESTWDLTGLPGMPAGYELDPAFTAPTSATFGEAGHLTTVTIHVLPVDDPVDPTEPPIDPVEPTAPPVEPVDPAPTTTIPTLAAATPDTGPRLPWTGATVTTALVAALIALAAGTALLVARRRHTHG